MAARLAVGDPVGDAGGDGRHPAGVAGAVAGVVHVQRAAVRAEIQRPALVGAAGRERHGDPRALQRVLVQRIEQGLRIDQAASPR